jgi:hypothetical protein
MQSDELKTSRYYSVNYKWAIPSTSLFFTSFLVLALMLRIIDYSFLLNLLVLLNMYYLLKIIFGILKIIIYVCVIDYNFFINSLTSIFE